MMPTQVLSQHPIIYCLCNSRRICKSCKVCHRLNKRWNKKHWTICGVTVTTLTCCWGRLPASRSKTHVNCHRWTSSVRRSIVRWISIIWMTGYCENLRIDCRINCWLVISGRRSICLSNDLRRRSWTGRTRKWNWRIMAICRALFLC